MKFKSWFALLLLMLVTTSASAQVLPGAVFLTPTAAIEVTASADHSRTTTDGTAWVTNYRVDYYLLDSSGNIPTNATPAITTDAGKPTPDANNLFRIQGVYGAILPDIYYRAKVAAVGPGGAGVSDPTGPFAKATPPGTPAKPGVTIIR